MEKKSFSIIGAINDCINRRSNEFVTGNIISLPLEMRAEGDSVDAPVAPNGIIMVTGEEGSGNEVVPTQLWDVIGDLKDKMVLHELGARFIQTNSVLELPRYSGEQATWLGEIDDAKNIAGKFSSLKITPKRLSAYLDISNTWLEMNGASAEALLRDEISKCLAEKLQKTILSNEKGSDLEPQGLFYGVTADTKAFGYNDAVAMEEQLELANVYGNIKYCVNPSAKSALRQSVVDQGSGKFVFENNEILGIPALSTNSVVNKGIILGDFSELYIATFGNVRFTVDSISKAISNQTRLVISMDCNYAVRREEAFVKRIMK